MKTLIKHGILFGGVFMHEGHIVQFTINDDDRVEINEQLQGAWETYTSTTVCSAVEALEKQQALVQFGYDHYSFELAHLEEIL